MKVHVAEITPYGAPILVAIVPSAYTTPAAGDPLLRRIQRHYRAHPIMLVSVERNGYRAYAKFQTHLLLALIQLEMLDLVELDLDATPIPEEELPF